MHVQLLPISHLPNIRGSPFFRSTIVIDASTLHIFSTYRYIFISQTCISDINALLQSENIHFINHRGVFRGGVRGVRPLKFAKHMLCNVN
jgi:hypothetical protein